MDTFRQIVSFFVRKYRVKLKYLFRKKPTKKVLFYLGAYRGGSLSSLFAEYEECYVFEANPEHFTTCQKIFKNYPFVKLFNVAVSDYDGEIDFHITNNQGQSSSVGIITKEYKKHNLFITKTIKIPCISLLNFIEKKKIDYIDDYISDLQGYDLHVLKSLQPLLKTKKIKNITCEVLVDEKNKIYDLPDNSEKGFNKLLGDNYECVAKGWGTLTEGKFEIPENYLEYDCKWRAVS